MLVRKGLRHSTMNAQEDYVASSRLTRWQPWKFKNKDISEIKQRLEWLGHVPLNGGRLHPKNFAEMDSSRQKETWKARNDLPQNCDRSGSQDKLNLGGGSTLC